MIVCGLPIGVIIYRIMDSLQEYIIGITLFINNIIIPFFFGLALLFFIWNAFRFFILGNKNEPDQENAKKLAIYGIAAFVLLVSIWGIVNLLVNGLNLSSNNYITPDYIEQGPFLRENVRQADYCRLNPQSLDCR
jgi:ABC-type dipeptide/oligopeptide/nickel transport system permease component